MKFSQYENLNKILAVIDTCQTNSLIDFSFNLPKDFFDLTNPKNTKGRAISKYVDANFNFKLTRENKQTLITDLANDFAENEICHYTFYSNAIKIGEGFDYCEINFINP